MAKRYGHIGNAVQRAALDALAQPAEMSETGSDRERFAAELVAGGRRFGHTRNGHEVTVQECLREVGPPSRCALRWTTFACGWLANRSSLGRQASEGWCAPLATRAARCGVS
jgi:hypothetical protein